MTIPQRVQRSPKGIDELNHKIDQLTHVVKNFVPVIRELKTAYDASFGDDSETMRVRRTATKKDLFGIVMGICLLVTVNVVHSCNSLDKLHFEGDCKRQLDTDKFIITCGLTFLEVMLDGKLLLIII